MSKTVGIDLGTTYSLVADVHVGRPRILARGGNDAERGGRLVPSVVGLGEEGQILIGQEALNQFVMAPERTVRSVKRLMGSEEPVKLGDRAYLPEEISSFILLHLKQQAESVLGEAVTGAVITVPAYFSDTQRAATRRAGELAGLEIARILNEPTAAALAYAGGWVGSGSGRLEEQHLLVYDLGGGTFDVSVVEQVGDVLEVRASHGNVRLGGDDFDERLVQHLLAHLSGSHPYDFKADRRAMARLLRAAERAKVVLSSAPYARVAEEFLARYEGKIVHLDIEVGRAEFEGMIDDLLRSTQESIEEALREAKLLAEQLNRVLLVGGSTRIPRVRELIEEQLGIEPSLEIHPDEAVALGAAVQAAIVDGEEVGTLLIDVAPHSLGIEVAEVVMGEVVPGGYRPIIRRNTTIPTTKAERFFTLTPDQDTVHLRVFQGESRLCEENTELGDFRLTEIPPGKDPSQPREVIVEFSYNLNGMLEVTAGGRGSEGRESITVSATTRKRAAFEPETPPHFAPQLEQEIGRALESAARLERRLSADGEQKPAGRVRAARQTLERARAGESEPEARAALDTLDDLLYDLG